MPRGGVDMLARVMSLEQRGELAVLAARALGQTGLPSAERPLIRPSPTARPTCAWRRRKHWAGRLSLEHPDRH